MQTAGILLALAILAALVAEGVLQMHEDYRERRHVQELEKLAQENGK